MGHRLTRIYTRTGDDGSTGLGDGTRVPKDHPRVAACGEIDEINSMLGLALAEPLPEPVRAVLAEIQHRLLDLGGELGVPGRAVIDADDVAGLERVIDALNEGLPPLRDFVLPGGGRAAAACHLARAVCRRAERALAALARAESVNPESQRYLNRLSDLLFVCARVAARAAGEPEVLWRPKPRP